MVNIYTTTFTRECPAHNGIWVNYRITIRTRETIMVENISAAVHARGPCYHEDLADWLHEKFGGYQVMTGHHHGVEIETQRGELAA